MPSPKSSRQSKAGRNKKKTTAQKNATKRIAERERSGENPKVPRSAKRISQSRFPGETPLTGEDRPLSSPRRKQRGFEQSFAHDDVPAGPKRAPGPPSPLRRSKQNHMIDRHR